MSNHLDRDNTGRFQKGNTASLGNGHPSLKRLIELRSVFMDCVTHDRMASVELELFNLATREMDPRVRLAACVEYLNRVMGKPTETVAVSSTVERSAPVLNISAEQQRVLAAIIDQNPPDDGK